MRGRFTLHLQINPHEFLILDVIEDPYVEGAADYTDAEIWRKCLQVDHRLVVCFTKQGDR